MNRIIGRKPVLEALQTGKTIDRVIMLNTLSGPFEKEIRALCKSREIPLIRVPKPKIDREVKGNHQGIYGIASLIQYTELEDLVPFLYETGKDPVLILLDGLKDVRNVGSIARSAEVFGADGIVIPLKKMAPINEIAVKTSAGALLNIPVCRHKNLVDAIRYLKQCGFTIYGAMLDTKNVIWDFAFEGPVALVLGSEEMGMHRDVRETIDRPFRIPQKGRTQSLNVSIATGIVLYEIYKQKQG